MKTITNLVYAAFVFVALAIGASTGNGAPGDLIAPDSNGGNIFQIPINPPFGTPSLYWNNANLPPHYWGGMAFDQAGNLYLSENPGCNCGSIYKLTPDRNTLTLFATGLYAPAGLAVDTAGNLYEADTGSETINKFTPDGVRSTFVTFVPPDGFGGVSGNPVLNMAFDSQGNLYVASGQHEDPGQLPYVKIYKISPQGVVGTFVNLPNAFQAAVIAFDNVGNLFVLAVNSYSSPFQRKLFKYTSNGAGPTIFGATQGDPDCVSGFGGLGLVIDSAANIYTSDRPATIRMYPPSYACGDPVSSIYIGNGYDPYETLGQLAIQPAAYAAQVQPPINADGTSIFNAHRGVVSIRFALSYGGAATCTLPPASIAVTRTAGGVMGQVNESVYSASADLGANFRINGCQYMYNLDSSALGVGTYRVDIKIYGGAVGSAVFQLK